MNLSTGRENEMDNQDEFRGVSIEPYRRFLTKIQRKQEQVREIRSGLQAINKDPAVSCFVQIRPGDPLAEYSAPMYEIERVRGYFKSALEREQKTLNEMIGRLDGILNEDETKPV